MQLAKLNRPSTILIALSGFVLVLGISLAYIVLITANDLRQDASIINTAGLVRGGMQRLSKTTLSERLENNDELIAELDNLVLQINIYVHQNASSDEDRRFLRSVEELSNQWNSLKLKVIEYSRQPSLELREQLFDDSEYSWEVANNLVFMSQYVTERKVADFSKIFYLMLVSNVVSIVVLILVLLLRVRNKLEYESSHDMLTGLLNRRAYNMSIQSEVERNLRYELPVSLILFDIDHFKKVNDNYGHKAGDAVLRQLSQRVLASLRKIDSVYRIGGEEFAIICPDTELPGAQQLADKLRQGVESMRFEQISQITISLGVAEYDASWSVDMFYQNADKALYLAKNNGRNRVEVFQ